MGLKWRWENKAFVFESGCKPAGLEDFNWRRYAAWVCDQRICAIEKDF
jgi:hypothetical protein